MKRLEASRSSVLRVHRKPIGITTVLGLVALFLVSPGAQSAFGQVWGYAVDYVEGAAYLGMEYPVETTYTLERKASWANEIGEPRSVRETIPLPFDVWSGYDNEDLMRYHDGGNHLFGERVQTIHAIELIIHAEERLVDVNGNISWNTIARENLTIPVENRSALSASEAHVVAGSQVWWPDYGNGNEKCGYRSYAPTPCLKILSTMEGHDRVTMTMNVNLTASAYAWTPTGVSSVVPGRSIGISKSSSGEYEDLTSYTTATHRDFGENPLAHPNQGGLIDGTHVAIVNAAMAIEANLPDAYKNNTYAFARATFDYLVAQLTYDTEASTTPRTGPQCLTAGTGDCDEQTNAFLSILRVKEIPGWYVFGALTNPQYNEWEGHGWGMIALPFNDATCEDFADYTCYISGAVDVVNRKWLIHTPTAYIDWIEQPDPTGAMVSEYYGSGNCVDCGLIEEISRDRTFHTNGTADTSQITFPILPIPERF